MTIEYARYDMTLEERLWRKVNKSGDCWVWTGATAPQGWYGHFVMDGRHYAAHRVSYELAFGAIPAGLKVLHRCDNPRCVRPEHLFIGTQLDNIADAVTKGRMHPGEQNGMAKLNADAVRVIRSEYTGRRGDWVRLARRFGVTEGAIRSVVDGKTWRHVEDAA